MDSATLRWRQFVVFARNFLRHPLTVGTFAPSSPFVVRRLLRQIDWDSARTVVEYGPGVGTITTSMLRRMHPDARLLVIETNTEFVCFMREHIRDPRLIVRQGSAAQVLEMMDETGLGPADCIVSGIPFSTMPERTKNRILTATAQALGSAGLLVVYQWTQSVLMYLDGPFKVVDEAVEWRNLWPMRLFLCHKRGDDAAASFRCGCGGKAGSGPDFPSADVKKMNVAVQDRLHGQAVDAGACHSRPPALMAVKYILRIMGCKKLQATWPSPDDRLRTLLKRLLRRVVTRCMETFTFPKTSDRTR